VGVGISGSGNREMAVRAIFYINIFLGWGTWHFVYIVIEGPGAT